ncbi:MAG: hypothetical protein IKL88_01865, partial [Erysipelotrichales bacterium]|nr:hypothetical protein [Erysipelotrichales bacterium]
AYITYGKNDYKDRYHVSVSVYQYADPETAFVEVRSNYGDGFGHMKMYVRTHRFFEILDEVVKRDKSSRGYAPCPVSIE